MVGLKKLFMYLSVVFLLAMSGICYASGVTYSTKPIGENTIEVTLKAGLQKGQGIEITSAAKREGKELNIFYRIGEEIAGADSMKVDLRTMLPPVRIILTNIDKPDEGIFKDIKGLYSENYIRHLHDMGALNGYPDGTFKPKNSVTRAEFVTMLLNALKLEKKAAKAKGFKDTGKHWAKNAISTACEMKIVSGFKDGTFKPDKTVTAAEAVSIITRLLIFRNAVSKEIPELNKKHWAYDSLKKAFTAGLIIKADPIYKGFKADGSLNRADCAMIISRAITTN